MNYHSSHPGVEVQGRSRSWPLSSRAEIYKPEADTRIRHAVFRVPCFYYFFFIEYRLTLLFNFLNSEPLRCYSGGWEE